jgi:glutamate synthase domain-containing protein 3
LAEKMVAEMLPAIQNKAGGTFSFTVGNCDRSIGARLSGEIAKIHGDLGMRCASYRQFNGYSRPKFWCMECGRFKLNA